MRTGSPAIHGSRPIDPAVAGPSDDPWVRWTTNAGFAWAILDGPGTVRLDLKADAIDVRSAVTASGQPVQATFDGDHCLVQVGAASDDVPPLVRFTLR